MMANKICEGDFNCTKTNVPFFILPFEHNPDGEIYWICADCFLKVLDQDQIKALKEAIERKEKENG